MKKDAPSPLRNQPVLEGLKDVAIGTANAVIVLPAKYIGQTVYEFSKLVFAVLRRKKH